MPPLLEKESIRAMKLLKKQILPGRYPAPAFLVTLTCPDGFSVMLSSAGAAVRAVLCPQPDGSLKNIALSFADDAAYAGNGLYAGAVLAPAAGRISNGVLPVGGRMIHLTRNENGVHTLHGGAQNASFRNWTITETGYSEAEASVTFSLTLPDGLDGFPGTRHLTASYRLTSSRALSLTLTAISDKETYIDMSSHAYFNLSGDFGRDALSHELLIRSRSVAVNRPDFIPDRIVPVESTPFDFTSERSLKEQMAAYPGDPQLKGNCGWNHCFVLEREAGEDPMDKPALTCSHPGSSVRLRAYTDAPCMVLYSGGYIETGLPLMAGLHAEDSTRPECAVSRVPVIARSVPSCGLAFEFQGYADAPGGHGFPYRLTPAGQLWTRRIRWEFELEKQSR